MKELREIKSRYEFSLDTRQAVLIVSGLVLVMMLSFLMGTLFGKNLARMAASPRLETARATPPPETRAPASTEEIQPAPVAAPSSREKLIAQLESMKVPSELDPGSAPLPSEPAQVLAKMADPEPETADVPKPEPAAPKPAQPAAQPLIPVGAYTIQLASLPDKTDAQALINELSGKRYDAYMLQVTLPGKGTFYRVRVGHYRDVEQAQKALKIMQSREGKYYDAWITQ